MINKIIASYILFACLIAIALKLGGVDSTLHLGTYFHAYLEQTNRELLDFKIAIPDIPEIPSIPRYFDDLDQSWLIVINVLIELVNMLSSFINFFTRLLNVVISLFNVLIQVIEMIFIFLKNLVIMKDSIIAA